MEEFEVKFLDIDPQKIEKKLEKLGAKRVFDKIYWRKVFDYPNLKLNKEGAWIRIRYEGDRTTLTFKKRLGTKTHDGSINDQGMEEIELEVEDFEKMSQFLEKIGLKMKFLEENRRIRYELDDIEFDIDFWPKLKPYLEIEAKSWEKIAQAIKLLGLNPDNKRIFSTQQIYKKAGINEDDYSEITFKRMVKKK